MLPGLINASSARVFANLDSPTGSRHHAGTFETLYQELIDAEATAFLGTAQRNDPRPRLLTTTADDQVKAVGAESEIANS